MYTKSIKNETPLQLHILVFKRFQKRGRGRSEIRGAGLALELFNCTANSVACERAFSTMNFLHTKLRNRMTITTTDKLLFIYINSRSLRKAGSLMDKYQKKKGQKELDKATAQELND